MPEQSGRDAHIGAVDVDRADRVERREGVLDLAGEGDPDRALEGGEHGLELERQRLDAGAHESLPAPAAPVGCSGRCRWFFSAQVTAAGCCRADLEQEELNRCTRVP